MKIMYLTYTHGLEGHRVILVTADKDAAVHLAKTYDCERGCQVIAHEVGKFDAGKRVYPDW